MCSSVESKPTGLGINTSNFAGSLNKGKPKRDKLLNIRYFMQHNRTNGGIVGTWESVNEKTGEITENNQYHRCFKCGRTPHSQNVGFSKHIEYGSAGTVGVMRCGSVWRCPVCRDKIIQERANELREIESQWVKLGNNMYMLTLTIPHFRGETAGQVYGSSTDKTGLSGCIAKLRQSALWSKHFKKKTGYVADVRTVESTYGKNGYHIHIHMLVYSESEIDLDVWEPKLRNKWNEIIKKVTGKNGNDNSLRFDRWTAGSDYMAKWGSASELTSETAKSAKNGNVTISQLEYALVDEITLEKTGLRKNQITAILKQYYADMDGQRLMQWGGKKGFKNAFIEEKSDQEIVDKDEENHITEVSISGTDYTNEIYNKGRLSTALNIYENLGKRGLIEYLNDHNIKYQEPFKSDQDIRETCSMVHAVSGFINDETLNINKEER